MLKAAPTRLLPPCRVAEDAHQVVKLASKAAAVRRVHKSYSTSDIEIFAAAAPIGTGAAVMSTAEVANGSSASFVLLIVCYLTLNSSLNLLNKVR